MPPRVRHQQIQHGRGRRPLLHRRRHGQRLRGDPGGHRDTAPPARRAAACRARHARACARATNRPHSAEWYRTRPAGTRSEQPSRPHTGRDAARRDRFRSPPARPWHCGEQYRRSRAACRAVGGTTTVQPSRAHSRATGTRPTATSTASPATSSVIGSVAASSARSRPVSPPYTPSGAYGTVTGCPSTTSTTGTIASAAHSARTGQAAHTRRAAPTTTAPSTPAASSWPSSPASSSASAASANRAGQSAHGRGAPSTTARNTGTDHDGNASNSYGSTARISAWTGIVGAVIATRPCRSRSRPSAAAPHPGPAATSATTGHPRHRGQRGAAPGAVGHAASQVDLRCRSAQAPGRR
uniref:Uncharacterized protein n=1 Tax=Frankia torreyi TaxID=1856 RepID=Q9AEY9_9ACTN|nr:hypothetical protein [Frankia torreyi]